MKLLWTSVTLLLQMLAYCMQLASGQNVIITVPPMNTSVIIGNSFTLTCVAEGGTITWERDNVLVGNGLLVGDDLVFMEALPDHTGIYECIARNGSKEARAAATVTVSYPPVFVSLVVEPSDEVINGTMVTFNCTMNGFPTPNVTWFHNGDEVVNSSRVIVTLDGILILVSVHLSDAGMYSCNGTNILGTLVSDIEIMLRVYFPPINIMIHGSPPDFITLLGDSMIVTCNTFSMPQSIYTWWKEEGEGNVIVYDSHDIMIFNGNGTLLFTMIQREDAGRYYCSADNGYGNISSDYININIIAVPLPPIGITTSSPTAYTVYVDWVATPSYPTVGSYIVEYRLDDRDDREWLYMTANQFPTSLLITDLLPYGRYQLRISALSPAGQGGPSDILIFMTDTGVPLEDNTTETADITSVSSRSIIINWTIHLDIIFTSYTFANIELTTSSSTELHSENVSGSGYMYEVSGLIPNTLYCVSLRLSFVGGFMGPEVQLQTTTLEDVPESPPQNVTATIINSTSVMLSWLPPLIPNGIITSYNVSYMATNNISEIYTETETGEEVLLTGLCPFTTYNVSVSASTAVGEGPSQSINFTTLQEAPQPPTIIMSRAISSTQLMLSWQLEGKVPGIISGYNVTYYMTLDSEDVIVIKLGPSNESIILNDLEVWSQYNVCINAATEGGGPGEPSCIIRRTLSEAPVLQLVIESVIPLCPPSLLVTWQPVTSDLLSQLNGPIEDTVYTIQWNDEMEDIRFNISTTEFIIPDLMLETEYTVSLAVTNSNGTGPISGVIQVTTPPPGALDVSDVTLIPDETSILVSWEAPPTDSTHLQYIYNLNIMDVININITNTSYTITGLTPATEYIVLVKADSGCGFGQSVSMTTNTLESLPGPPVVTIVTVSSSSVSLKLEEPLMPNGLITHYMVMCGEESVAVEVMESYYVCMDLKEEMLITITVWAVNSAGDGDIIIVNTMTACKSTNPKVDISDSDDDGDDDVIVTVELSTSCPNEDYVLIVVMEITDQEQQRPLSTYSIDELIMLTEQYDGELQRRQVTMATIYIAANLSRQDQFQLGDGMKYGEYINYGLKREVKYVVGVVAVSENSTNPTITMTSSDFIVPDSASTDDNSQGFPIHLAAGAGGGIILILVVVIVIAISILVCCRKRRRGAFNPDMQGKGSSHSFERGASVRISGRRGNKPTDPVEEYRANYHTEALESHIPVPINGFINKLLVMRTNDNQLFLEEFGSIEMAPQQPCSIAELPGNRAKNRYHNILPYDHSRVKLSHSKGQSEYINASYCSGFMKVQGFVATQGPLPDTVPDFWRVVWEQNSRTIVMLTNAQERLKTKCEVYWPREVGCSAVHSGIEVTLTDFTQLADYTIRSLTLTKAGSGKEVREVRQFHFTSWPDHGVPQYATAMLAMVRRVQAFHTSDNGPMIVHCSAGVGRTGTFIVIYSMLERMKAQRNTIDIYGHVSLLRTQRNYMVQTEDQYFFIYEAVAEVIVCGDTEVPIDLLEEYVTDILSVAHEHSDNTNIELEFKRLAVDKSDAYRFVSANKDVNKAKNRYVNVLPYETRRVVLQYQRAQEGSDYINASFIDGYHYRNAFIATQGPLQNTLADFWRMVWENNVPLIVMLTKCHEKGTERSAKYWPSEVGQSLMCGHYKVEMTVERKSEHYTYRDILLIDIQNGRKRQLRHFHYLSWPEVGVPSSSIVLLDFLREIQKNFATLNTKSPITVHCSNGIGRSGIFIALHIILERMVAEGLVDVFQTIKNLRIQRPAMVQTLEQYQFCYTLALDYLESSDLINQLRSSTRSDSIRAPSNSSELRSSRRSLNRNDSLRSSAKRSSRNLEMTNASNGVTTTVYGGSEATSTFGTTNQQQQLTVGGDEERQISPLPPSPTHHHHLLTNPHLAHLDHGGGGASQLSQSSITSAQGSSSITQSNTLPIRGGGTSGFMQSHWGMAPTSSSQTSLSRSTAAQPPPSALSQGGGGAYPISSFKSRNSGGPNTSQDSLDQQFATLALNINNSNNCTSHVVDVYIEP